MKTLSHLLAGLLFLMLWGACDKIEPGNYVRDLGDGGPTVVPNDSAVQKVLLEEFTGVKCNNCPEANRAAKNLQSLYGKDRLILLGIHAGNLATTDANHPKAFNTAEGTELFSFFNLFGVPVGFVNRKDYSSDNPFNIIKSKDDWGPEITPLLDEEPMAQITIAEDSYNAGTGELTVSGRIDVLQSLGSTDTYYCVYLAENKIISPQTMGDKSVNPNYEHNHVFRGSFNTTFGQPIDLSSGTGTFSESITLPIDAVKENCEVIVFLYDRDNYRIIQVNNLEI